MPSHLVRMSAEFTGGSRGEGSVSGDEFMTRLGLQTALGGNDQGTSPSQLLLGAVAGCYLVTLGQIAERMHLPLRESRVDAAMWIDQEEGTTGKLGAIELRPEFVIDGPVGQWEQRFVWASGLAETHGLVLQLLRNQARLKVLVPVLLEADG